MKSLLQRPTLEHPVTNKYVCGVKGTYRSGRVVGGDDATPGEWCWQVRYQKFSKSTYKLGRKFYYCIDVMSCK